MSTNIINGFVVSHSYSVKLRASHDRAESVASHAKAISESFIHKRSECTYIHLGNLAYMHVTIVNDESEDDCAHSAFLVAKYLEDRGYKVENFGSSGNE